MPTLSSDAVTTQPVTEASPDPISIQEQETLTTQQDLAGRAAATNQDTTAQETLEKYGTASAVDLSGFEGFGKSLDNNKIFNPTERLPRDVPFGAEKKQDISLQTSVIDRRGNKLGTDLRVKIKVPPKYLDGLNKPLSLHHGIIFPYTPQIQFEQSADYGTTNPVHSNYSIYFYQRSKIGSITISGKFSVQNENDAAILIATIHCLKSLTKMRFGGAKMGDTDSGAPPPVCRLSGHGTMMFDNVPVVVQNFRFELPDNVDYFTIKELSTLAASGGVTSLPVLSTIAVTLLPVYSREEMQNFSVTKFINGSLRGQGYL